MIPEFGQLVRQRREQLGLRVVDVVRLLGIHKSGNEAKPIRVIEELEKTGKCDARFFKTLITVLQLDEAILATLAQEHEDEHQRALDAPIPPTIYWITEGLGHPRFRPHGTQALPHTTAATAIEQACRYARKNHVHVRLRLSLRQSITISAEGEIEKIICTDSRKTQGFRIVLNGTVFYFAR